MSSPFGLILTGSTVNLDEIQLAPAGMSQIGELLGSQTGTITPGPEPEADILGVNFDGTSSMFRGDVLTGQTAGATGIWSMWFKVPSDIDGSVVIDNGLDHAYFWFTNGRIQLGVTTAAGNPSYTNESNVLVGDDVWHHVLISIDGANQVNSFYVDDVESSHQVAPFTGATSAYHFDYGNWSVGCFGNGVSNFCIGDFAEIYFAPNQYLDFSIEANRRKFITAEGLPADLGVDGSTPTGTPPAVYMSVRNGDAAADFSTNRGNGGAFNPIGALTLSSTNPGL